MKSRRLACSTRAARAAIAAIATTAVVVTAPAFAHDTWFERLPGPAAGEMLLALGTGNQFPRRETGIDARYLATQGCSVGGRALPLRRVRDDDAALVLRAPAAAPAATCWVQIEPFEVTLAPDKVELYLREVGAGPALRATWAAMQQRGLPWRERYTKHARFEAGIPSPVPAPVGMDLVIEGGRALVAGGSFDARVLRDGQPVAGLPVELRSEDSPLGIWRRSDAEGRLRFTAPAAGRWLLRAVDLRTSATDPDRWDSRFATLAFRIGAAGAMPAEGP